MWWDIFNMNRRDERKERTEREWLVRIESKLDRLLSLVEKVLCKEDKILEREVEMAGELDTMIEKLRKLEDAGDGMALVLKNVKAALDAAGTDPARLAALSAEMGAKTDTWVAETLANTIADPNAPPA
jgi:hypothetical protein